MTKKNEWRGVTERRAHCLTCGKKWYESNAHGVGAKHARTHKHSVIVEITRSYCYFHEDEEEESADRDKRLHRQRSDGVMSEGNKMPFLIIGIFNLIMGIINLYMAVLGYSLNIFPALFCFATSGLSIKMMIWTFKRDLLSENKKEKRKE